MSACENRDFEQKDERANTGHGECGTGGRKELEDRCEKFKTSTRIIYFYTICVGMSGGLFLPTLWPFVHSLGGSKSFLGVVVSAYHIGRIFGAPLFGFLSDTFGHKSALVTCSSAILMGSAFYAMARNLLILFIGYTIIGIGAASSAVTRSYIAATTPIIHRVENIAFLAALYYIGYAGTPVIGSLSASGAFFSSNLSNYYPAPAYILAVVHAVAILALVTYFAEADEIQRQGQAVESHPSNAITGSEACQLLQKTRKDIHQYSTLDLEQTKDHLLPPQKKEKVAPKVDRLEEPQHPVMEQWRGFLLHYVMFMNFMTKGTLGVFETLTVIIATGWFEWTHLETGLVISVFGFIGVFLLAHISTLLHYFHDFELVRWSFVFMILACLLLNNDYYLFSFHYRTSFLWVSLFSMFAIGYPIGYATLIGMFSKILAEQRQGKMLGLFSSTGSIARVVFPIAAGLTVDYFEHFNLLFLFLAIILSLGVLYFLRLESVINELVG